MWTFRFLLTILLRRRLIIARLTLINLHVFPDSRIQKARLPHGPRPSLRLLRGLRQNPKRRKPAAHIAKTRARAKRRVRIKRRVRATTTVFSTGPGNKTN
jgi:hypothetical protein